MRSDAGLAKPWHVLAGVAAVVLLAGGGYFARDVFSASTDDDSPADVLETVSQSDIGRNFGDSVWLEEVTDDDDLLGADEAMQRYADAHANIDGDFPLRESPKLVRFASATGHDGEPMYRNPELERPLWALVLDTGVDRTDEGPAPGDIGIHVIFIDAETGEYVMGFQREGVPGRTQRLAGRPRLNDAKPRRSGPCPSS